MKILLAGSGKMGTDIFDYLSAYPNQITWLCIDEEAREQAESGFLKKANRRLRSGMISQEDYDGLMRRISVTSDSYSARDCSLVIEAIWENTDEKKKLFRALDDILPEHAIITSNTSSIPVHELIPSEKRRAFFAGLHFFYPVKLKNIVEVNIPEGFDESALQELKGFLTLIARNFIVLHPEHHFILNRMLLPVQNEAFLMWQQGRMPMEAIDAHVQERLFPGGIFGFFDHVGIDIMLESVNNYAANFPGETDFSELISCFRNMVSRGKLGTKSGEGFYQYPKQQTDPDISKDPCMEPCRQLEQVFFGSVENILKSNISDTEDMLYAINEYLGTDIVAAAGTSGHVF